MSKQNPPLKPDMAKRNLAILTGAQILGASSPPIIIAFGGLVGRQLIDDPYFATLPVSLYQLGVAASVLPAAFLMQAWGRRNAYLLGVSFGLLSGLIAAGGIIIGSFLLFCLGTILAGFYGAYVQSYRFAATDNVAPDKRSQAISIIMIGGLIAAIIGPQLAKWTFEAWPGIPYAGSFLSQTALAALALPVIALLYAPRRQTTPASDANKKRIRRPISEILRLKNYILGVAIGAVSYGLMSFLMTASPMAMEDHAHDQGTAILGIQLHILAMFGPSFFTGYLIKRYGAGMIAASGLILIMLAAAADLSGIEVLHFYAGLILLGLGWNFGFIGSTTMITEHCSSDDREQIQGINDFVIFGVVALSSFFSGALLHHLGWFMINILVFPLTLIVLLPLLWGEFRQRLNKPFNL